MNEKVFSSKELLSRLLLNFEPIRVRVVNNDIDKARYYR